jgi:1-acyl-sn-glycerol-3-phosphate acyltransferase
MTLTADPTTTPVDAPVERPVDPDPIGTGRDPEFIRRHQGLLETYASYFKPEVRGFEQVPATGPFLVVGNHSGGATPPDLPILMTAWWRERGADEPIYGLFHSAFMGLPGVGNVVRKAGALEAGWDAAERALDAGAGVVVYPGGDHEAFRPSRDRDKIDFAGRTGFIKLALRMGVPIVPAVSCGAHDTVRVLTRGERLVPFMPHLKLMRTKVAPVMLGFPWGVSMGIPTLPLPAQVTVQLGPAIDWRGHFGPEAADDPALLKRLYTEVTSIMQATLDRLAAERGR